MEPQGSSWTSTFVDEFRGSQSAETKAHRLTSARRLGMNRYIGAQPPESFNGLLSITVLGGGLDGLNRVDGFPSVKSPGQCRSLDPSFPELLRHTDGSCIVGSTTVGDQLLSWWKTNSPFHGCVRQYPN